MTTGSYSDDFRDPNGFGLYRLKSWNGQDDPKIPREAFPPPQYIYRAWLDKKGRANSGAKVHKIRVLRAKGHARPPKRGHHDLHFYHMSLETKNETKIPFVTVKPGQGDSATDGFTTWRDRASYSSFGINLPDTIFDSNDQLKIIGKLREQINGSDFHLGKMLGEGHQTLRMIADTAIRLRKFLWYLRGGRIGDAAHTLLDGTGRAPHKPYSSMKDRAIRDAKDYADRFLEFRYGWQPLLSDVEAGARWLANRLEVPFRQRYVARISKLGDIKGTPFGGFNPLLDESPVAHAVSIRRRQIIAYIDARPNAAISLGLLDVAGVAWEVTPWSFVVDWFIPVGSFLDAYAFSKSVSGLFATTDTHRWYVNITGNHSFAPPPSTWFYGVQVDRVISTSLDVPFPNVKPLGQALSWGHCANALALLLQQPGKIMKTFK